MVKGDGNAAYKKLLSRFNKLQDVSFVDNETESNESFVYVISYSVEEFEKFFNTTLSLEVSDRKVLKGICQIGGIDKSLSVSKSTQYILCSNLVELDPGTKVESPLLASCHVSLCVAKGKNFWLITKSEMKRSRCFNILNANINVDVLLDIWEKSGIEWAAKAFKEAVTSKEKAVSDVQASLVFEDIPIDFPKDVDVDIDIDELDAFAQEMIKRNPNLLNDPKEAEGAIGSKMSFD